MKVLLRGRHDRSHGKIRPDLLRVTKEFCKWMEQLRNEPSPRVILVRTNAESVEAPNGKRAFGVTAWNNDIRPEIRDWHAIWVYVALGSDVMDEWNAVETVAHEFVHAIQWRYNRRPSEAEAERLAAKWAKAFFGRSRP